MSSAAFKRFISPEHLAHTPATPGKAPARRLLKDAADNKTPTKNNRGGGGCNWKETENYSRYICKVIYSCLLCDSSIFTLKSMDFFVSSFLSRFTVAWNSAAPGGRWHLRDCMELARPPVFCTRPCSFKTGRSISAWSYTHTFNDLPANNNSRGFQKTCSGRESLYQKF